MQNRILLQKNFRDEYLLYYIYEYSEFVDSFQTTTMGNVKEVLSH